MADEKTTPTQDAPDPAAKAAKSPPKKEKPPALEDKPFTEFMEQNFLPTLATALQAKGIEDIQLTFDQRPLAVFGVRDPESYWQSPVQHRLYQRRYCQPKALLFSR